MTLLYDSISSFPGAGNVSFSLRNTPYQNNSLVILEDIGEGDNALLCINELTACCQPPYADGIGAVMGNWYFPNGTRVPSAGSMHVGFLQNQRSQCGTSAQKERWGEWNLSL